MRRETGRLQLHRNTFKYCKRFELLRIINLSTLNGEMDIIWLISLVMAAVALAAVAMAVVMHYGCLLHLKWCQSKSYFD